jgi:hypothetical protein
VSAPAKIAHLDASAAPVQRVASDLAALQRRDAELRAMQGLRLQRPPAWRGAKAPPVGCWCSSCRGHRWWRAADGARGWKCRLCCPPPPGVATTELRTPSIHHPNPQGELFHS